MVNLNSQLGRRIRERRTARGLTQEELAHRAGLDYSYLNQMRTGGGATRPWTRSAIGRIARALGVSVQDLVCF